MSAANSQPWRLEPFSAAEAVELQIVLGRGLVSGPLPDGPIPLDRAVGDPVELLVDGRLVARGEVVVVDDKLAVRIVSRMEGGGA